MYSLLLCVGLSGLVVLALVMMWRRVRTSAPGFGLLSVGEVRFLDAVSDTVFPSGGAIPVSGTQAGIPAYMDRYLDSLPSPYKHLIRALFFLFEWTPLLFLGRPSLFSSLQEEKRKAFLEGWESSRLYARRMSVQGLKTLLCIAYMADPRVRESIGFVKKTGCHRSAAAIPPADRHNGRNVEGIVQFADVTKPTLRESTDFCIIGSGAAGAVLAHELAAAGKKVVVLEEGSYWTGAEVPDDPAYALRLLFREAGFRSCRGKTFVPTMQASCVGGTTFVNSSICFRFPERILGEWATEFGITHLTPETLAPSYERVERIANIKPVDPEILGVKNRLFQKGAQALGLRNQAFSRAEKDCRGCSECMPACPAGAKQSMDRSYLPLAVRHGAVIYADCRAEELMVRGGRAFGVRGVFRDPVNGRRPGGEIIVDAKAVILAAGVMDSPVILLKNRIGNSSGWVGRNLVHHPGSAMFGLFHEAVNPWEGATQGFGSGEYLDRDIKLEVIWGPPAYLAVRLPGFGLEFQNYLSRYRHAVAWDSMVRGASRGRVTVGSGWNPRIEYRILQADVDKIVEGLRVVAEMLFAAGAHTVLPGIHGLPCEARHMGDLDGLRPGSIGADRIVIVSNHAFGTCRMGADPRTSVVGPSCESHDVKDLYVCDSSVFPSGTGVNPMEPIMAVADLTAQELKRRY